MGCLAWLSPALSVTLLKEETMLVYPVVVPGRGTLSWTVLGDDDVPVVPVDRFLAYLSDIGRSPNTVKAYAHDLKDYWCFLGVRGLDWREARLEDVGEFVAWLQLPLAGRSGAVAVLPSAVAGVSASTVNRKLAAVSSFYAHQARHGAQVGDLLAVWKAGGRGGWKPFLHHVSKGKPFRGRAVSLRVPAKLPRILTVEETQAVLDACTRLRDRFFFALLHETGCRAGEALGLRHEDIAAAECEISVVSRDNANGARAKSGGRTIPVGGELIRLYADYLHAEYGSTDSDYVFINIWAGPRGQAWSYRSAYDLVQRLRSRTGLDFDPHWFRHSAATRWLRDGVPAEVVSKLLGHSSVTVTSAVYGHLTAQDARGALEKAGWFTGREVSW
jgi:integrase/recombinase XerD